MSTTLPLVTEGLAVGGSIDIFGRIGQELQSRIRPGGLKPEFLIEVVIVGHQHYDLDPTRPFDGKRLIQHEPVFFVDHTGCLYCSLRHKLYCPERGPMSSCALTETMTGVARLDAPG
jgi:hypothetical protein